MVVLKLTETGKEVLRELSIDHSRELNQLAPQLIRSLEMLSNATHDSTSKNKELTGILDATLEKIKALPTAPPSPSPGP